ncbi:MAG: hypothetical protein RLZZ29_842 [Cyanobacteriota bacterium]
MPRTAKKPTATIDPNLVNIADFCTSQGISEQIFRLELMQFVDNADSVKSVNFDVASQVASTIQNLKPALPQIVDQVEIPETIAPQELQPATETPSEVPQSPQNSSLVGNTPKAISSPATGANIPSLLDELIQESEEAIGLADLVHRYRNQQIVENAQSRDLELVATLRERRIENINKIFDSLRDLNARQPIQPDLPELPSSLKDEIKSLSDELGKRLSA